MRVHTARATRCVVSPTFDWLGILPLFRGTARNSAVRDLDESSPPRPALSTLRGSPPPTKNQLVTNPGWGAPRIHGELLKLGIDLGETTVAKYMVHSRWPSSQTWKTFLKNHLPELVSADFFVVPTATFRLLFVFLVLSHDRRRILHWGVTAHPTAEWTAQQLRYAFPWDTAPPCATAMAVTENPSLKSLETWASRRF